MPTTSTTSTTTASTTPPLRTARHDELIVAVFQQLERRRPRSLNDHDAEDALQQCLLRVIEQIHVLAERHPTPGELAAAVWASAAPDFRRSQRIQKCQGADLVPDPSGHGKRPKREIVALSERQPVRDPRTRTVNRFAREESGYAVVDDRYELLDLLRILPPRIRQLLWLVRVEGRDVTEAAADLGWSRCHASRQLHKAEGRLRRLAATPAN